MTTSTDLPDRVAAMVSDPDEALAVMKALREKFEIAGVDVRTDGEIPNITRIKEDIDKVTVEGEQVRWMDKSSARMFSDLLTSLADAGREAVLEPEFQERMEDLIRREMNQDVFNAIAALRSPDSFFLVRLTSSGGSLTFAGPQGKETFASAVDAWTWASEQIYRPMPKPGTGVAFSATLLMGNRAKRHIEHELEILH